MSLQAAELGANVEGLLIAVKSTRDFEAEMAQKFGGGPAQPEPEEVRLQHSISAGSHVHCTPEQICAALCFPLGITRSPRDSLVGP